jgi:hypothetical protein
MRLSLFVSACLFPIFAMAQDAPSTLPSSEPASAPASVSVAIQSPPVQAPQISPEIQARSTKAFYLSLFTTVGGYAGSLVAGSLGKAFQKNGSTTISRVFFSLGGTAATAALVGPSAGHFWAGETERGTKLTIRRLILPGVVVLAGLIVIVAAGGDLLEETPEGVDFTLGGRAVFAAGTVTSVALSARHILDARNAPIRVSQKRVNLSQLMLAPAPIQNIGTSKLMPGLSLSLNF